MNRGDNVFQHYEMVSQLNEEMQAFLPENLVNVRDIHENRHPVCLSHAVWP